MPAQMPAGQERRVGASARSRSTKPDDAARRGRRHPARRSMRRMSPRSSRVHGSRGISSRAALQRLQVDAARARVVCQVAERAADRARRWSRPTCRLSRGTDSRAGSSISGPMSRSAFRKRAPARRHDEAIATLQRQRRRRASAARPPVRRAARTAVRRRSAPRARATVEPATLRALDAVRANAVVSARTRLAAADVPPDELFFELPSPRA